MHANNLPNAPDNTNRRYTGSEIAVGTAVKGDSEDWTCAGCGTRLDATVARMCPDCGHTVFDYDPTDE